MSDTLTVPKDSLFDKLVSVAIIGLLSWTVYTTNQTQQDLAVLSAEVNGMDTALNLAARDRYTSAQAASDFALIENKIERVETWSQNLSERVRFLEQQDK